MEVTPQSVRTTAFKTVKKGYDPAEVDIFKNRVASAIESSQNQATAMEARARAAVAKLQELTQQASGAAAAEPSTPKDGSSSADADVAVSPTDAESISRTLLLAQRTADATVAEARREADSLTAAARSTAAHMIEEARSEARLASEDERLRAEGEVQALLARRDFLISDVDHLEQHIAAQRERLHDAAVSLQDLVDRVPGGLGEIRRPLLSASDVESSSHSPTSPVDSQHGDDEAITSEPPEEPSVVSTQPAQ